MSQQAVGMIQVMGYPAALAVADTLVKAANVQLVSCEGIGSGYWTLVIRGAVAEVNAAVQAVRSHSQPPILSHQIIAQPQSNLEQVLPIRSPHAPLDDFLL
ncbi:carbon dioxide-concentrating mechanism protein CcmK [Synechococcus sp. PCC 6717]|jgi:carbon dioxide concentrating mechanism protein CcmK|uniref:Carbon dioxide concentrating mechanism protein n=1 Tax=Parathermosynechococcus lividus PCC 6715 TaxID=1917166 RepID=A0A2D2Q350_PARLV|nr:carbon dioxide-concentrating mechanism protein CcmK [Thermostichus lividus]ATS18935.1 carbon dioxide concentrating mechanism protein [Thermostichus lividus PCC 6715]MCH9056249.1 carbon dioxide-concentrating mechanism protein CcmK [Synechococcus sp. PCC 6716]MCI3280475.1 carbon dioxide-concentrating mechanism protein CcmK [Synechococcus sp. PCC 6717]